MEKYLIMLRVWLVGAAGFEPATTRTPSVCATRLRHAPTAFRTAKYGLLKSTTEQAKAYTTLFQSKQSRRHRYSILRMRSGSMLAFSRLRVDATASMI